MPHAWCGIQQSDTRVRSLHQCTFFTAVINTNRVALHSLAPVAANKLTLSLRAYSMAESMAGPESASLPSPDRTVSRKRRGSWVGTSTFEFRGDILSGTETDSGLTTAASRDLDAYELESKEVSPGLYSSF